VLGWAWTYVIVAELIGSSSGTAGAPTVFSALWKFEQAQAAG
jgi:ABC-type nitrate/sulfonate/bicarbonate transport system permease component